MAGFGAEPRMSLKNFVFIYPLPQCAKVIEGYYDPSNINNEFSANDVIEIRGVTCPHLDLTFCRPSTHGGDVLVRLPTDVNTLRFRISDNNRKRRVFRGVDELIDKRPRCVKAIGVTASPTLPTAVLKGEVLQIVGVEPPQPGCQPSMLELKTSTMQIVRLPLDYAGSFEEVVDRDRLYSLEELAWLGSVPRTLTLDVGGQLPASVPTDFQGDVNMAAPQLLVDVSVKRSSSSSSSSDDDDDDDRRADNSDENKNSEDDEADGFLVPIDSEISLSPRPEDYEALIDVQCELHDLPINDLSFTKNVFRVLSWHEETPVLHYHSIRPGDRLTFYRKQSVRKLKASVDGRFFFIPISHKGHFTSVDGPSSNLPVVLSELATNSSFPFRMQYQKCAGASTDPGLPSGVPLLVHELISEDAVLATKVYERKTFQAFCLPLRTQVTVGVERDAADKTKRNIFLSAADSYAEEVSERLFNGGGGVTMRSDMNTPTTSRDPSGSNPVPAAKKQPPPVKRKSKCAIDSTSDSSAADDLSTHATSSTSAASERGSVVFLAKQLERSLQFGEVEKQAKPPVPRRSQSPNAKQPQPVSVGRNSSMLQPSTDQARPEPPRKDQRTAAAFSSRPPTSSTPPLLADFDDQSETAAEEDPYSYASEDIMWKEIVLALSNKEHHASVPMDFDVSGYTTEQLVIVMRMVGAPDKVLLHWYKLGVDGRAFATMTDADLRTYDLDKPLVRQLRDSSRNSLLKSSPDSFRNDVYVTFMHNRDV